MFITIVASVKKRTQEPTVAHKENQYKQLQRITKLVHEIWNATTCTSIGIHRGINRRLSFYAFEFWKKYTPSVREIRATYWNNLFRDKFMCIDIQTDRPTYIKWFTMELRNNPSLAQNTVHTLMMMFILDFDIYTFGVILIKCFGLLLSLREEESMGEWKKRR